MQKTLLLRLMILFLSTNIYAYEANMETAAVVLSANITHSLLSRDVNLQKLQSPSDEIVIAKNIDSLMNSMSNINEDCLKVQAMISNGQAPRIMDGAMTNMLTQEVRSLLKGTNGKRRKLRSEVLNTLAQDLDGELLSCDRIYLKIQMMQIKPYSYQKNPDFKQFCKPILSLTKCSAWYSQYYN